jgi:hypothetical protein
MPSSSKKQHDFMEAIAHNKAFAKKVHVPQSVGRDFAEADKGKHFKRGGNMAMNPKAAQAMAALMGAARRRPAARAPMAAPMAPPAAPMAPAMGAPGMAHGGLTKAHHKHLAHHHLEMAEHHMHMHEGGMKHGGKAKHHYAKGGHIDDTVESKGSGGKKEMMEETKGMKKGSSEIMRGEGKRAHGEHAIQMKGHTKAMMPKMAGTTTGMKHGGKAKVHHKK